MQREFAHYRLLEELGQGGGGIVYLAEDTLLLRRVAIKFPRNLSNPRRMLSEARAASALTHPGIAAIYDCGDDDGQPYIVMELVDGGSLSDLIGVGPMAVDRAIAIAIQAASALVEAHSHRIIHRDIKPSNIRVDRHGAVKIVDFGLAKTLTEQPVGKRGTGADTETVEGIVAGTPRYMSPEQALGKLSDERTDIFSLGVVLYECLTGRASFSGANSVEILSQVLHVDPPAPSVWNSAVPPALNRLVQKAMAKDREMRYQSAGELLRDLETFRETGKGPALQGAGPRSRLRSKRVWAAGLAAVATAGIAGWLARAKVAAPPSAEVMRWYAAGTAAIRENTYYQASQTLERAVALNGAYPPAQARLAEAYNELDDASQAQKAMLLAMGRGLGGLPPADRLTIQAIHCTITQDLPGAVTLYRTLLANASQKERPARLVDLGRALENAQNPAEALVSYREAARLEPDYPAPYLRLGILCGRRQDQAAATAAFDRAEALFQTLGNMEGVTEVLYQRALQATNSGQVSRATTLLERALRMADAAGSVHHSIVLQLQFSLVEMRKGDTAAAEKRALDAVDLARRSGLERLTSRGLVSLGSAFLAKGNVKLAEQYYLQGLELARNKGSQRTEARALLSLGSLHEQLGDVDKAEREVQQALPFYERGGYEKERAQSRLLLGRLSRMKGDFASARTAFQDELKIAERNGDKNQLALLYEALGETELACERYPDALANFREKIRLSHEQGNRMAEGFGLLYSGSVLWRMGRYREAVAEFQASRAIAGGPGGFTSLTASIDMESAWMALSQIRPGDALAIARRLRSAQDNLATSARAEHQRLLGESEIRSGNPHAGEERCRAALDLAQQTNLSPLISDARLSYARAMLEAGKATSALEAARQVEEDCSRAARNECKAAAATTAARAAGIMGNAAMAKTYAHDVRQALAALVQSLEVGDRKTFQMRPDVLEWRRQIGRFE
jgi:tetratricopeptide (TPR) repeat protein